MAVVNLPAERVEERLSAYDDALVIAGYVAPVNTVISGDLSALERFLEGCKEDQIDAMRINVGYACHCKHMQPYLDDMTTYLKPIRTRRGRIPVWSTVTNDWLPDHACGPQHWARNNREPVRLFQSLTKLMEEGEAIFVEISPHPV